jgi:hypothetical protein
MGDGSLRSVSCGGTYGGTGGEGRLKAWLAARIGCPTRVRRAAVLFGLAGLHGRVRSPKTVRHPIVESRYPIRRHDRSSTLPRRNRATVILARVTRRRELTVARCARRRLRPRRPARGRSKALRLTTHGERDADHSRSVKAAGSPSGHVERRGFHPDQEV